MQTHTFTKSDWTLLKSTSITNKIRFAIAQNSRNLPLCFSFSRALSLSFLLSVSFYFWLYLLLSFPLFLSSPICTTFLLNRCYREAFRCLSHVPSLVFSYSLHVPYFSRSFVLTPSLQNHAHTKSSKLYQIHFRLCSLSLSLPFLPLPICLSLSGSFLGLVPSKRRTLSSASCFYLPFRFDFHHLTSVCRKLTATSQPEFHSFNKLSLWLFIYLAHIFLLGSARLAG